MSLTASHTTVVYNAAFNSFSTGTLSQPPTPQTCLLSESFLAPICILALVFSALDSSQAASSSQAANTVFVTV